MLDLVTGDVVLTYGEANDTYSAGNLQAVAWALGDSILAVSHSGYGIAELHQPLIDGRSAKLTGSGLSNVAWTQKAIYLSLENSGFVAQEGFTVGTAGLCFGTAPFQSLLWSDRRESSQGPAWDKRKANADGHIIAKSCQRLTGSPIGIEHNNWHLGGPLRLSHMSSGSLQSTQQKYYEGHRTRPAHQTATLRSDGSIVSRSFEERRLPENSSTKSGEALGAIESVLRPLGLTFDARTLGVFREFPEPDAALVQAVTKALIEGAPEAIVREKQATLGVALDQRRSEISKFTDSIFRSAPDARSLFEAGLAGCPPRNAEMLPSSIRRAWHWSSPSGKTWLIQTYCSTANSGNSTSGQLVLLRIDSKGAFTYRLIGDTTDGGTISTDRLFVLSESRPVVAELAADR